MKADFESKTFTTPPCRLTYAWLVEPDTKYPPAVYKVTAHIDAKDSTDLEQELEAYHASYLEHLASTGPGKKLELNDKPWKLEEDDQKRAVFSVKMKRRANGVRNDGTTWSAEVALFDSQGKPLTNREPLKKMGPETTGRLNFVASGYTGPKGTGVTCKVLGAQILNFVEYSRGASSFGFQAESTGFKAGDVQEAEPEADNAGDW